jgi:predicted transport protein
MAKDSQRLEQEFIATVQEKTGKSLQDWLDIIGQSGLDKPNAILKWLKDNHQLNHLQANLLSGIYLNDGEPVFNHEKLFQKLFADKGHLLPLYEALQQAIAGQLSDTEFIPTKAYVSIEAKRCFACATLTKNNIRVGLDLGDLPFDDYTQKAKSLGAMPNLTHMVEISEAHQINKQLIDFVKQAYRNAHST